jgi:thiamine biosynthesis lipoprotein
VSLGESSVYALGRPSGAPHWTVAVRGVRPDEAVGSLALRDQAISVSATFGERGPAAGRAGHIVDPRSGRALGEEAVGVVVAPSATDAEAWSKALLVWGRDGLERVDRAVTGAVYVGPGGVSAGPGAARAEVFHAFPSPRPLAVAAAGAAP